MSSLDSSTDWNLIAIVECLESTDWNQIVIVEWLESDWGPWVGDCLQSDSPPCIIDPISNNLAGRFHICGIPNHELFIHATDKALEWQIDDHKRRRSKLAGVYGRNVINHYSSGTNGPGCKGLQMNDKLVRDEAQAIIVTDSVWAVFNKRKPNSLHPFSEPIFINPGLRLGL